MTDLSDNGWDPSFITAEFYDAMSLFGSRTSNRALYMRCLFYIKDQIEKSGSQCVLEDNIKDGITEIVRHNKNIDSVVNGLQDDDDVAKNADISGNEEQKIRNAASYILHLFIQKGFVKIATNYGEDGYDLYPYVHLRSLGRIFLQFAKRASEIDKPEFSSSKLSSLSISLERVISEPESPDNYDRIMGAYKSFTEALTDLDSFADEFSDFAQEYQNMALKNDLKDGSSWVDKVFRSEYFAQYLIIKSEDNNTEYGNYINMIRTQAYAATLLSDEWRPVLKKIASDMAERQSELNKQYGNDIDKSVLYTRYYKDITDALTFLSLRAVKQYRSRTARVEREVKDMIDYVRHCVNNLTSNTTSFSLIQELKTVYQYMLGGHDVRGITNMFLGHNYADYRSLQPYKPTEQVQTNKIEIPEMENDVHEYDAETGIEAVNKFVSKLLSDRDSIKLSEVTSVDRDPLDYKWGVVNTLNAVLYYGQYGKGCFNRDLPKEVIPCYRLERNEGDGPEIVTMVGDSQYIYPDVSVVREETV